MLSQNQSELCCQAAPECSICFEEIISEKSIYVLECNHIFHIHCLDKWYHSPHSNYLCPLCMVKRDIIQIEDFNIIENYKDINLNTNNTDNSHIINNIHENILQPPFIENIYTQNSIYLNNLHELECVSTNNNLRREKKKKNNNCIII